MKPVFLLLFLCSCTVGAAVAQTCCSGGVPLVGNLGLPAGSKGTWQLRLGYDINVLKTLMEESNVLDDGARERITQSILLQTGYSISDRWSADFFISMVEQQRTIRQFNRTDHVSTFGMGDAALLIKYSFMNPQTSNFLLTLGAGPKLPTGKSDVKRADGIPLNADLQPGSGAWDGIIWANGIYGVNFRPSLNISSTLIYSYKGRNNAYLGSQSYKFGNEFQALFSINDYLVVSKQLLDLSLTIRYRHASEDQFNEITMPNTGGQWIFGSLGFAYNISSKLAVTTNFELPIYSFVGGTQLSPTYRFNAGLFLKLNTKNELLKP